MTNSLDYMATSTNFKRVFNLFDPEGLSFHDFHDFYFCIFHKFSCLIFINFTVLLLVNC